MKEVVKVSISGSTWRNLIKTVWVSDKFLQRIMYISGIDLYKFFLQTTLIIKR